MITAEKYTSIRKTTEDICFPLETEDYTPQVVEFASPAKWHLAHTTWFFEEMVLKNYLDDYTLFDPSFGFLFNSYYNNIGKRINRINRGSLTRPTVEAVYEYRKYVDNFMCILLKDGMDSELETLIELGLNHEQQHQELLFTDIKFLLSANPIHPIYKEKFSFVNDTNSESGFVTIEEGVYEIGARETNFHFDNEEGRHKVYLNEFTISKNLVTNGEFIEFIQSGGYENFNYWLDDGWSWLNKNNIKAPLYWEEEGGVWHSFTLGGFTPIDKEAILTHISYYEANAFANWKEMRLATEFEWEIASEKLNWGARWEWTNSAYLAYPNFTISKGAVGEYNGKFMVNQMVLRGASNATSKEHSRNTYRNFFQPYTRWQFSGIRLIKA